MKAGALVRLGGLSLMWGSVFLWIKISGYAFSPVEMVFARLLLGAVVVMAIGLMRGQRPPREAKAIGHLVVAALLGNVIPWLLFAQGEIEGSSNIAGIVSGTGPVWTLVAAVLLGSEKRLGAARIWGMVIGLTGVVLVAAPWNPGTHASLTSVILFALGAVSFGSSFAYIGRFLTGRGIPVFMLAGSQLSIAAVLTLVAFPFFGLQSVQWRTDSTVSLIILGVVCTGFAVLLNTVIITKDGPAVSATVIYLMTVVSVILGSLVLGEPLGWTVVVGTVAVLAATALLRRKPAEPVKAAVSEPAVAAGDPQVSTAPAAGTK
jgi:drug/metabolite transporter (DMT)-like permease